MTILLLGIGFYAGTVFKIEGRSRQAFESKKALTAKAREVITLIQEDETPQVNHLFDEFFLEAQQMEGVILKDVSSYLNLNTIDQDMMSHIDKVLLNEPDHVFFDPEYPFKEQGNLKEFNTFRNNYGPLTNRIESCKNYILPEVLEAYFTDYSYYNFNITDPPVMQRLYAIRTKDHESTTKLLDVMNLYNQELGTAQSQGKNPALMDRNGLEDWFTKKALGGTVFDAMFPILNTEAQMNIHFVPEEIIAAVLSYPNYNLKESAEGKAQEFVNLREDRDEHENGLTEQDFRSILGSVTMTTYPATKIQEYFGFITWFWEIVAVDDQYELHWIVARIPPEKDINETDAPVYKVVKEEFFNRMSGKTVETEEEEPQAAEE